MGSGEHGEWVTCVREEEEQEEPNRIWECSEIKGIDYPLKKQDP